MAQLRLDYDKFKAEGVEVIIVGPDSASAFRHYWQEHDLPFVGLPDPKHSVLKLYGQQIKIFKFGRMPAQVLIDKLGTVRYVYYGKSMSDIPASKTIIDALITVNSPSDLPTPTMG
jgi:peroxiredoxin Q/BCP